MNHFNTLYFCDSKPARYPFEPRLLDNSEHRFGKVAAFPHGAARQSDSQTSELNIQRLFSPVYLPERQHIQLPGWRNRWEMVINLNTKYSHFIDHQNSRENSAYQPTFDDGLQYRNKFFCGLGVNEEYMRKFGICIYDQHMSCPVRYIKI